MMIQAILNSIQKIVYLPYEETRGRVKKKILTLTEDHKDALCKEVKFEITDNILVYKFDKVVKDNVGDNIKHPLMFLSATTPIRSLCDYLIFYKHTTQQSGEKLYVVICNMKSGNSSNMEEQMKSGTILSEFILQTAIRCHNSWNSQTKTYIELDYNKFVKDFVIFKEIAIYSKLPPVKGNSKPQKNPTKRSKLICDKTYQFDLEIHF